MIYWQIHCFNCYKNCILFGQINHHAHKVHPTYYYIIDVSTDASCPQLSFYWEVDAKVNRTLIYVDIGIDFLSQNQNRILVIP